jgi:apolipoprotein D and lipocalin family protein
MKRWLFRLLPACFMLLLMACVAVPDGVEPVTGFDSASYLGTWYEIVRLDHSFERGLSGVTANYTMRDDGGIRVLNRGYDAKSSRWKEAEGRAYFVEDEYTGF